MVFPGYSRFAQLPIGLSRYELNNIERDVKLNKKKKKEALSVWEERANFSAIDYLLLYNFCSEWFPLGAGDRMCYCMVLLPGPFI